MTTFDRRRFVVARIHRLVGVDPSHLSPTAGAQLAQLRRALGKPPGSVPEVWAITMDGLPDDLRGRSREREELAIHLALTHFASHQQGQSASMHAEVRPFAAAVRILAGQQASHMGGQTDVHETAAYRHLVALASSSNLGATVSHARGLINQLKAADLAFDYGRYVDDLYWLQVPGQVVRVQRGWGRDFHSSMANAATQPTTEGETK